MANSLFIEPGLYSATTSEVVFVPNVAVPDEAYGSSWNGSLDVPTKNAVYDKIQTDAGGTVTSVAQTVPGGFSISGSPVTTTGTLAIAASGTSGGILGYTATGTTASSVALTAGYTVIGGGAGATPTSVATGAPVVSVLTDGATPALNAALGTVFTLTALGNRTIGIPTNPTSGQKIIIQHLASGGARTLSLNTGAGGFRFGTDITGLTATGSGLTDYIGCVYNAGASFWDCVAVSKGY